MDMLDQAWKWLKSQDNREVIKLAAAAVTAIVGAGWMLFTFLVDHRTAADHPPSQNISASGGAVSAGRDASGNTITITAPQHK